MKLITCSEYSEISKTAADILEELLRHKPHGVYGFATGDSPLGLYRELIRRHKEEGLDFSGITSFNLDEYYPIKRDNDQSYNYFMHENFFKHINIKPENINILNGEVSDTDEECSTYEKRIEAAGGLDFQLLGVGPNGHIAFNEPDEELHANTYRVKLTESTIEANSRFFESMDEVPKEALTMGIGSIMRAKKIIMLAMGEKKRYAIEGMLSGKITTKNPATLLNAHPDVTLITDLKF